ncbi:hypothetical protein JA9_002245 [Meyerozyma sp. JA9]|nr:hypothetical protein JA9_002245 [Meyerozyma sp. JA9]
MSTVRPSPPVSRSSSVVDLDQFGYLFNSRGSIKLSSNVPEPLITAADLVPRKTNSALQLPPIVATRPKRKPLATFRSFFKVKSRSSITLRNLFQSKKSFRQENSANSSSRIAQFDMSIDSPNPVDETNLKPSYSHDSVADSGSLPPPEDAVFSPGTHHPDETTDRSINEQLFGNDPTIRTSEEPSPLSQDSLPSTSYWHKIRGPVQAASPAAQYHKIKDRIASLHVHWLSPLPKPSPSAAS